MGNWDLVMYLRGVGGGIFFLVERRGRLSMRERGEEQQLVGREPVDEEFWVGRLTFL